MTVNFTRHLLIDGANVLHAWPELAALMKRDRDAARSQLITRAGAIHDSEEVRVTIVFDGRGEELTVERPSGRPTFSVLYTPSSVTADDVIERLVAQSAEPASCVVATADHGEAETARSSGATVITPADLESWVARAESRQALAAEQLRRSNAKQWKKP